jgi:hypothetical protein
MTQIKVDTATRRDRARAATPRRRPGPATAPGPAPAPALRPLQPYARSGPASAPRPVPVSGPAPAGPVLHRRRSLPRARSRPGGIPGPTPGPASLRLCSDRCLRPVQPAGPAPTGLAPAPATLLARHPAPRGPGLRPRSNRAPACASIAPRPAPGPDPAVRPAPVGPPCPGPVWPLPAVGPAPGPVRRSRSCRSRRCGSAALCPASCPRLDPVPAFSQPFQPSSRPLPHPYAGPSWNALARSPARGRSRRFPAPNPGPYLGPLSDHVSRSPVGPPCTRRDSFQIGKGNTFYVLISIAWQRCSILITPRCGLSPKTLLHPPGVLYKHRPYRERV